MYFANPKTGSQTTQHLMNTIHEKNMHKRIVNSPYYHDHYSANHWKFIMDHIMKDVDIEFSDLKFTCTTIRNPWARIVSSFKYGRFDKNGYPFYHPSHDQATEGRY